MTEGQFPTHREAALALLNDPPRLSRRAGGFLGQIAIDPSPLTEKQAAWLARLLKRAGLSQVVPHDAD